VLTRTATPIPAPLHGVTAGCAISRPFTHPPEERLPDHPHIGPYAPRLVPRPSWRELERGGQVFFVHNRVQTIEANATHLNSWCQSAGFHRPRPDARKRALDVMHRFTTRNRCAAVYLDHESGLDIPNANTLIVGPGDTFGLAQLYQLRDGWGAAPSAPMRTSFASQENAHPEAGASWK